MKRIWKIGIGLIGVSMLVGCTAGGKYVMKSKDIDCIVIRQPDQINGKMIDGTKAIKQVVKVMEGLTVGEVITDTDDSERWDYSVSVYGKNSGDNGLVWIVGDKIAIDGIWHTGSKENKEKLETLYDDLDYIEQRMR